MAEKEIFSGSPEENLANRSWKKLERDLQKEGFREGALKGREESYQAGFDLGYAEGYRLGEVLGFFKGNSSLLKHLKIGEADMKEKEKLFGDNEDQRACILCQEENLIIENVDDILLNQKNINDVIISNLWKCGNT